MIEPLQLERDKGEYSVKLSLKTSSRDDKIRISLNSKHLSEGTSEGTRTHLHCRVEKNRV